MLYTSLLNFENIKNVLLMKGQDIMENAI